MKIVIIYNNKQIQTDFDDNEPIENLKYIVQIETGIPDLNFELVYFNMQLENHKSLKFYNIIPNSYINVKLKQPNQNQIQQPSVFKNILSQTLQQINQQQYNPYFGLEQRAMIEAQKLKQFYVSNPDQLNSIFHQNAELAQLVVQDNIDQLYNYVFQKLKLQIQKQELDRKELERLEADPFNPENQRRIEELIQQKNIDQDLEFAQEYLPETFTRVTMLYVDIKINKYPIQAFVDSGAQQTIMSKSCAEKCGIIRLVDTRFKGTAVGVGTSKIMGKVHNAQMQIGEKFFSVSLTILENDGVDFLLGLDFLKKFQCCIDLNNNCLTVNKNEVTVNFLQENQLKSKSPGEQESQIQEIPQQRQFDPQSLKQLMDLGFSKNQVIEALQICDGNTDQAGSYLFQQNK